jgi:glycosyltransferase involved in cell wall biosynthesis
MARALRVLWEASCLVDARRDAGIGRYARQLRDALQDMKVIDLQIATPKHQPWSESRPGRFLNAQPAVLRLALQTRPDLLHGVGGEPVSGFPLQRQIVTIHDVEMWRAGWKPGPVGGAQRRYADTLARGLRGCAGIIAVSRTSAEEAFDTLGIEPARIAVVPHGVSSDFSAVPNAIDADVLGLAGLDAGGYVLWTGSLRYRDPRKGLDTLLEALVRMGPSRPKLALVGAPGAEADRLSAEAARSGVTLRICGSRPDPQLAAMYRGAAALALPSNHEGFGLTVLEAMACATPVVATTVGNIPDLAGGAAALVPANDPAALAGALRRVLEDAGQAERMRRAGLERAAGYTWERTARLTLDVYRDVYESGAFSSPRSAGTKTAPSR